MDDAPQPLLEYYRALITQYERASSKWKTRSKKIIKRYLDERPEGQASALKYNILWSNVQTLQPLIYAHTPKPEVDRRFLDKDPVGRKASEVLERCIRYFVSTTAFGSTMRQTRDDYLLVGRGTSWVRYVPTIKATQITDDTTAEAIEYEEVMSDYVHWEDFGHNVARTWEEVEVVWRIVYMTRPQMKARGFADWNSVPLDFADKDLKDVPGEEGKKATVYEIWDKGKREVFWLTKSHPAILDRKADPLKLDKFFPCPSPIFATLANGSLIPVPDYVEYQDQATEIDNLTGRIAAMQKALKAAGVYDASQKEVGRLLSEGVDNQLIPVDSWAALNEKGGLANAIQLLPMMEVAQTLMSLYEAREKAKADLYEITGMSDIIRGATNPNETATAQNIKSNFASQRLTERQRAVQRFARNIIEIMGNVIARHFTLETIQKISGVKMLTAEQKQQIQMMQQAAAQPQSAQVPQDTSGRTNQPPAQQQGMGVVPSIPSEVLELMGEPTWDEVYALFRDNPDRSFRISIETDSTVDSDRDQETQERVQFLQAVGGFLQQAEQAAAQPVLAPMVGRMLEFGVRGFKVGRELEGVIDETVEKITKQAQEPQPEKPDPEMAKVQSQQQLDQAKLNATTQLETNKTASAEKIEQMRIAAQQAAAEAKAQSDAQIGEARAAVEQIKAHNDHLREQERQEAEDARERYRIDMENEFNRWKAELEAKTKLEVAEIAAGATLQAAQVSAASQAVEKDEVEETKEEKPDKHLEALTGILTNMHGTLQEMRKPRKIVRDEAGRMTGVE